VTLIKSISGIRGTIGGKSGDGLSPIDIVKFSSAFAIWIKQKSQKKSVKIVVGRDARISGEMVNHLVAGSLMGVGVDVIDLGLSTTPTVEMAVALENADGGIVLTASHNPKQWNALKLLNNKGEFISGKDGEEVLEIAENDNIEYSEVNNLGKYFLMDGYMAKHIEKILELPTVNVEAIKNKNFKIDGKVDITFNKANAEQS
jgi:phosphomannomutase